MSEHDNKEIVNLQVTLGCSRNCEPCSKYFDCAAPLKQDMYKNPALKRIEGKLETVKHKIAVMSGKGGVGKSTTTANLAAAFSLLGAQEGFLIPIFMVPAFRPLWEWGKAN